jgi:hypothetical protein
MDNTNDYGLGQAAFEVKNIVVSVLNGTYLSWNLRSAEA